MSRIGPEGHDPRWDEISEVAPLYDMNGEPCSMRTWATLMQDLAERTVARHTWHRHNALLSTVWTGVDYGLGIDSKPMMYETMAFGVPGLDMAESRQRYASRDEALAGHNTMLAEIMAHLGSPDRNYKR